MVHESLRELRLDRRLLNRRGWISQDELDRELQALPDVSEKVAPPEETESEESASPEPSQES